MTLTTPFQAEHQLDQVARQFAHWRQTRTHLSERIPPALWEQAVALTATLPPTRVAKQLRLRLADLKKQIATRQAAPQAVAPPAVSFVEVPLAPTRPVAQSAPLTQLELQRADGTRLWLRASMGTVPLDMVVRAFLEGH